MATQRRFCLVDPCSQWTVADYGGNDPYLSRTTLTASISETTNKLDRLINSLDNPSSIASRLQSKTLFSLSDFPNPIP